MLSLKRIAAICCSVMAIVGVASAQSPAQPGSAPASKPAAAAPAAAKARPGLSAVECEVWNRERSFAASVAHHDAAAFAEHVHAQAAFDASSPEPTRGRDAIVAGWKGIIEGKQIKLGWSPVNITLGGDGNFAVSSGPDWIEDLSPNTKQRYEIGEFSSIWMRDKDGQWRVLFDAGNVPAHPASAEDVAKLVASLPKECPRAR
jgi:ketosteroid isomerase-like protein